MRQFAFMFQNPVSATLETFGELELYTPFS